MIVDAVLVLFSVNELLDESPESSGEEPSEAEDEESVSKDSPEDASSGIPDAGVVPVRVERMQELPVKANAVAKPGTEKDAEQSSAGEKPSREPHPAAGDNEGGVSGETAVSPSGKPDKEPPVSPVEEVSAKKDGVSAPGGKDTDLTRKTEDGETPDVYNTGTLTLLAPKL
jgi:hypothetical protein